MPKTNHLTPLGGYSDAGAKKLRQMAENAALLTDFLRFQGRVFKHPASVALEFFTQKPDATFIATAAQWEKAGFTVTAGSGAIKFFDEHGKTIEMYDFSQCEEEAPPVIWAVTNQNLAAVKERMGIPQDTKLIDGLVSKSIDAEQIVKAMQMLNVPPQNHQAFQQSMVSSVAQIIAGRLSVNGGNFRVQTDNAAFKSLKTTEQRMMYLAIAGKVARDVLRQIERIVTETSVQAMLAEQEAKNAELRRMAESQRGREDAADGRGDAADSERAADESPDRGESGEAGRSDRLDGDAGDPERLEDDVVFGVQATEGERNPDVVSVQPDERDLRAAGRDGTVDGAGADWELRDSVDALHGVESPGDSGSDADEAHLPDDSAVGGSERVGVPGASGPAVRANVPAPERDSRGESQVGEDAGVLHGRDSDAGARPDSADKTVKQNTEKPSTDSAGGFSVPPATEQLRLFGMEDEPEKQPDPVADEKLRLLRDDLLRGNGFQNGKLDIADYYEQNQPSDKEFARYLRDRYGIGGHSGPDMPDVGYDGKGIHIISADKKGNYNYTWAQAAKEIRSMIERGEYITAADIDDAVDNALYYLQEVEQLNDRERETYTGQLKKLRTHPLLTDETAARIDAVIPPEPALQLSAPARYIMDEANMPMFVDRMVARDEMDEIAHRILDDGEDAASVAMDSLDESRYIISDHETFEAAVFAVKKDTDGVTITTEPDSEHPFSVSYSWLQIGEFMRQAAQLHRDVEREAEEAYERDIAENMEAYDALDHHRDVYLSLPEEGDARYPVADARKPDLHNYRLHFEPDKGYLLLADSDTENDLMLRNFTMVNSQIVLHGVQEMGFTVTGVQPAATYEIYQMKSGEQYHFNRWESLESNKDAGLTVADYDLVYTGDWSEVSGDSVQQRLDSLFQRFNVDHPADFRGHSMSTSDVVVVTENGSKTAYYVDTVSFVEMPDFFREKNYQLVLNDSEHNIQFGQTFVSLEAAQDAGNEAIWSGHAVGYAVLNRQEQKVEVYDSDFPASGVFSEEVYANSPFQTLTVHTDAPMTPEPPKKHRPTRAEQLYNLFAEMYPEIVSGEHNYERYEDRNGEDGGYEPLAVEHHGGKQYSWSTFYFQNGDLMADPDFCFLLDHENKRMEILSFQMDGVPPYGTVYQCCVDDTGNVDRELRGQLEQTFLQNLRNARAADRQLVRYTDENEEDVTVGRDEPEEPDIPDEPASSDPSAEYRAVLNAFAEKHGLGELNVQFDGRGRAFVYERFADGKDLQLFLVYPNNRSPEALQREFESYERSMDYRGDKIENVSRRQAYIQIHGQSELPPVPDNLPPIVYAKDPRGKLHDNLAAIRELHWLRRCEENGQPLYSKQRSSDHSKEVSDMTLRRYSGWGGLAEVFDETADRYEYERDQLHKYLTDDEYKAIRASVTDAHYTPQIVVDAMWAAVQSMGLERDSRILEPSCGTGNFISRMPHSIGNGGVVGVEIDSITAEIAARLHNDRDNVRIMNAAFEHSGLQDGSFDLAIGNVPFGDYKMNDPDYAQDWLIHDAFFRKALDKVAPGGVVAFITSSGTMDKKTSKVREYLATQAELVGAIRLPNTTFAEAGTGVTADIIFLKKRESPLPAHEPKPDWCFTAETEDGLRINSYFVQNPNMILGTMRKTSYFDRLTCDPKPDIPLKDQLRDAVASLNAKITVTRRQEALRARQEQIAPWGKDYSYHEKDGKIFYRQGEHMDEVRGNAAELTRMQKLIKIRTLTRLLLDKQKTNVPDEALTAMREKLNALYDAYVKENGALSSADNKKRFGRDVDYPILQSLENYNAQTQTYEKADIFYKRTVAPIAEIKSVETLDEAFQVSLDRRGKPDIPYMAALLQATEPDMEMKELMQKVERDLLASGLVFLDPEKQIADVPFSGITDRSEYLSGNVRRKLAFAEEKAKDNPRFQANVEALQAVIPENIHAEEITVRMGCTWIDAEDYTSFLHMLSGRDSWDIRCEVTYIPQTGEFDILKAGSRKDLNLNEGTTYGTDSLTMYEIALKMLNQTRIVVNKTVPSPKDPSKTITRVDPEKTRLAQEKAKQIEANFKEWIFADPKRKEKYEKRYNELFNALVGRQYDGSRLTFNGMATDFELRPHQRNCIARAVYGGNTLAAHVVGAGKSAVFITAVMKKKELGLINKACIVVPKALTEQTALEWRRIFPDARLLTVGEMDLSTQDKRDVFTARIATGNYDAVIVSREQFDKMAMSPAYQREYIQREIDSLEDMLIAQKMAGATKNTPSVKKIEAAKKRLEKRLENALNPKKMSTRSKDGVLEFEQLGFDYLVVDESHSYKNGFVTTKMTDVSGVSVSPSGRAQDMQMKCDWMNEMLGQGHILHCTGTPVSNSMTELYVVTRYLRPDLLKAAGVDRFDDWAATFGKVVTAYKQSPSGQLKLKTSFSKFANLPELMAMYKEFADIQSAEKLQLPRPELIGGKPEIVKVQASPEQRAYVRELAERAQLISSGVVDPHIDNLLKITGEARLIGLGNQAVAAMYRQREDGELPEGFMEDEPGKVDACIDRVMQYYGETAEQKGVQIIFSDIAVNSDNGNFSVYEYIRDELIARGIPKDEIIFAPKADSKEREAIFRDINDGKYRVVIGSTGTIGTGANIQQRLYACHHCDIPWKPSDFAQREGRILRQGNTFPEVRILNYVTEGTLDSYLYQVVTDKARFIAQLLDDECPARVSEDCDEKVLTYAELQAAAEGNPDFKTRIELSNRIAELTALKQAHQHEQGKMQKRVEQIPQEIAQIRTQIEQMQTDVKSAAAMRDSEGKVKSFDLVTPTQTIRRHEDINAFLHEQITKRIERPFDEMQSFRIGDFTVSVEIRPGEMNEAMLAVKGERVPSYAINVGSAANADNWQRIVNFLDGAIEKAISDSETRITKLEADLKQAQERVGVPFDGEAELTKAQSDFAELEARLSGLSEQQDEVIDPDETDEEETDEERAEREAYQSQTDDDDLPMLPDSNASSRGPRR